MTRLFSKGLRLVVVYILCAGAACAADEGRVVSADTLKVSTPLYLPSFQNFDPPLGKYDFSVRWQGIPAARLYLTVDREGENYRIVAEARTISAIELFYLLRYRGEGLISGLDLSPIRTVISQRENSRYKYADMTFNSDGSIHSVYSKKGSAVKVLDFDPDNFTVDPFSAAFLARSQDWQDGEVRTFDTFNGQSRYLITLNCIGSETITSDGVSREAWVISPKVENLTNPANSKKLRSAKIYLSKDKRRDVLQIVSKVFIGSVTTRLDSFTPFKRSPRGAAVALSSAAPHGS